MRTKQTLAGVVMAISLWAGPGIAAEPLHHRFADCTGKLSAQLEHEWLMSDAAARDTEERLSQFQDLLHAATPTEQQRATLHRRIEAKLSHSAVLTRATFNTNANDAAWAVRRARASIAQCDTLLLRG